MSALSFDKDVTIIIGHCCVHAPSNDVTCDLLEIRHWFKVVQRLSYGDPIRKVLTNLSNSDSGGENIEIAV